MKSNNIHMNNQAEQVLQTALSLPRDDRLEIAETLFQSLDDEEAADLEAAWAEEIKRRIESIDKGEVKLIPWEETIRSMRERLHGQAAD